MRTLLVGLATWAALGIVNVASAEEKAAPPAFADETYQLKVVNEAGQDVLVRAVSFNRNWDAIEVKKGESYVASDERHYFRKGQKVFIAYDVANHKVIAVKEVEIAGPTVITITADAVSASPLASK